MQQIIFATGNNEKVIIAQKTCAEFGIELVQDASLHVDEIQGEDGEKIARHKANEVYKILQKPCVITDDSWIIPALNGFPGAYMKSMNTWFTAEDWLRLMHGVTDRRIILRQIAVYQDEDGQQLFAVDNAGRLLTEIRGKSAYPSLMLTTFDGVHSIAEILAQGRSALEGRRTSWHELGAWLRANRK